MPDSHPHTNSKGWRPNAYRLEAPPTTSPLTQGATTALRSTSDLSLLSSVETLSSTDKHSTHTRPTSSRPSSSLSFYKSTWSSITSSTRSTIGYGLRNASSRVSSSTEYKDQYPPSPNKRMSSDTQNAQAKGSWLQTAGSTGRWSSKSTSRVGTVSESKGAMYSAKTGKAISSVARTASDGRGNRPSTPFFRRTRSDTKRPAHTSPSTEQEVAPAPRACPPATAPTSSSTSIQPPKRPDSIIERSLSKGIVVIPAGDGDRGASEPLEIKTIHEEWTASLHTDIMSDAERMCLLYARCLSVYDPLEGVKEQCFASVRSKRTTAHPILNDNKTWTSTKSPAPPPLGKPTSERIPPQTPLSRRAKAKPRVSTVTLVTALNEITPRFDNVPDEAVPYRSNGAPVPAPPFISLNMVEKRTSSVRRKPVPNSLVKPAPPTQAINNITPRSSQRLRNSLRSSTAAPNFQSMTETSPNSGFQISRTFESGSRIASRTTSMEASPLASLIEDIEHAVETVTNPIDTHVHLSPLHQSASSPHRLAIGDDSSPGSRSSRTIRPVSQRSEQPPATIDSNQSPRHRTPKRRPISLLFDGDPQEDNSDDDIERLLAWRAHQAASAYLEEQQVRLITECSDNAL